MDDIGRSIGPDEHVQAAGANVLALLDFDANDLAQFPIHGSVYKYHRIEKLLRLLFSFLLQIIGK